MKELLRKEIGLRMRKVRKSLGYTQEQIVTYFDIGRANYSRIEKGEIFPGASILLKLKSEFNVSLDWLIANEGQMFILEKEKVQKSRTLFLGEHSEEVRDLLLHLEKVPMLKHAVLAFFLEYKEKNKEHINRMLPPDKAVPRISTK